MDKNNPNKGLKCPTTEDQTQETLWQNRNSSKKRILIVIMLLFCIQAITMAETEQSLRKYFADNILNLDPIEGIYDVERDIEWDVNIKDGYFTKTFKNQKLDPQNDTWYIKESYKGSGMFYVFSKDDDAKMSKVDTYITSIGETGCYNLLVLNSKSRFIMTNMYVFKVTLTLNTQDLPPQKTWWEDGSQKGLKVERGTYYYSAIKSYPTASMYQEAIAKAAAKEREQAKAKEEAEKVSNWSGTGFALNSGHVVTNYHVIDGAKNIVVKGVKGDFTTAYHADVVASDKTNDLAILKINDSEFKGFGAVPYRIRSSMVDVGAYVWTLGYPMTAVMGDEIKYTDGKINSKSGIQGDLSVYQISIPIQPGNSGSPVFDKSGYVVGIASSGLNREVFNSENVNYAIKSSYLRMLIESTLSSNIFPNGTALQGISNTEQIKIAKNFVYMIQCTNRASTPMPKPQGVSNTQEDDYKVVFYPSVHRTTTGSFNIAIKKITFEKEYTAIEMWCRNFEWCNISPHTYIRVNGLRYNMTKAEGIKIAPEKTYPPDGGKLNFILYFPAIPNNATEMDLVEEGSTWAWYGIDISGK